LSLGAGTTGYNGGDFTAIAGNNFFSGGDIVTAATLLPGNILIQTGGDIGDVHLNAVAGNFGNLGGTIALTAGGDIAIGNALVDSQNGLGGTFSATAGGTIRTRTLSARSYTAWPPLPWEGGEIDLTAIDNILIDGVVQTDGSVSITTRGNLAIQGIASPGNYSIKAETVSIATGTPLSIANSGIPQSFTTGAIVAGGNHIQNLTLSTDTTLLGLQYIRIPPSTSPTPASAPNPSSITPAANLETAIAQALDLSLKTATVETPEGEAIAYSWGPYALWVRATTNNQQPTAPLTEDATPQLTMTEAISQIEATENRFTQTYLHAYPELEEREPIRYAAIRESLEQIHVTTGQNAAILYVWWDVEGLRLGVVRRDRPPIVEVVEVAQDSVKTEVKRLFDSIRNLQDVDSTNLSDLIISPVSQYLEGVDTIIFSLDEGLRKTPIAALIKNRKYLIETHAVTLIPSVALTRILHDNLDDAKVLAMGTTTTKNLSTVLQFVDDEIESISRYRDGEFYLDEQFTSDKIDNNTAPILHLAVHGSQDILELYDKNLKIEEFSKMTQEQAISLLFLSACETALDSPKQELGFAGLAARTNVNTAIAPIFEINDGATALSVRIFYKYLEDNPKATALRLAQLELISGYSHYSHPAFWAGLTLIGAP
ncbi:MAG: CHAT domain-containing protein, partial [Cyanobacteria bacterium SBLK]|nr:CHAT domain-containing protein [Cyanobacteria bacterium SBLK]